MKGRWLNGAPRAGAITTFQHTQIQGWPLEEAIIRRLAMVRITRDKPNTVAAGLVPAPVYLPVVVLFRVPVVRALHVPRLVLAILVVVLRARVLAALVRVHVFISSVRGVTFAEK